MESPAVAPGQSDEASAKPGQQQASDELRKRLVPVGHKAQDFVTPLKAAGARTMTYPSVQKSTPVSDVEASPSKGFDSIIGTAPVPVMQGIRLLIEEKEKELTALSASRVHGVEARARSLAEELQRKDAQLATLQNQLAQLTSDFKYNFKLLDERDAELEKQDQELARLRTSTAEMAKELQEARQEGGQWRKEAERRQQRVEETEGALAAYQEVVVKAREQLEDAKRMRDEEVAKQASEMGVLKAHLSDLNAQHQAEVEAAVRRAEESFRGERAAMEKRVSDLRRQAEELEERRRKEILILKEEMAELEGKADDAMAEAQETHRREVQGLQKNLDDANVQRRELETHHEAEIEFLERRLTVEYQSALLRLQEEHHADVSARAREYERERELAERRRGEEERAWAEERLTLGARLESAEREVRSGSVKWEERVRALQEERKQSEQHQQAMQARIEELERVATSQAEQLESAHRQSQMLQALVDDLHTALQSKEDSAQNLQKRLDDVESEKASAIAAIEREKAEAEVSLRQQLLGEYESKVAELLDTLRAMKEHVASETDQNSRTLREQVDVHEREVQKLNGLLEESRQRVAGIAGENQSLKEQRDREREDAQFVKSTLAARDAEVELLRGEVDSIQKEVQKLSDERADLQRKSEDEEKLRTKAVSELREELSARKAEVGRLVQMLKRAQKGADDLGFEGSKSGVGVGFESAADVGRRLTGFGVSDDGDNGFVRLRTLAAENEELRRRLQAAAQNPGGLAGVEEGGEGLRERVLSPYSRGDIRTGSGRVDRAEASELGELGFEGRGLGLQRSGKQGLVEKGIEERDFETGSGVGVSLRSAKSQASSPAIAKLYEEMHAVRRSVKALKTGHVAAGESAMTDGRQVSPSEASGRDNGAQGLGPEVSRARSLEAERDSETVRPAEQTRALQDELRTLQREVTALKDARFSLRGVQVGPTSGQREERTDDEGFWVLREELSQLKQLVRDVYGQRRSQEQVESSGWYRGDVAGGEVVSESGGQLNGEVLGIVQELKDSVSSLRAELESIQRAGERELRARQVDGPFSVAVDARGGANRGWSSKPHGGFRGSDLDRDAAENVKSGGHGRSTMPRQQITSAAAVEELAALQGQVARLTQELLALRSAGVSIASGPVRPIVPTGSTDGTTEKVGRKGRGFGEELGEGQWSYRVDEMATSGLEDLRWNALDGSGLSRPERKEKGRERTELERPALAPSAMLQREIAEVRAELAALRSGQQRTERKEAEQGVTSAEIRKGSDVTVRWVDENEWARVGQQTGRQPWKEEKEIYNSLLEGEVRPPRAPLLTWTDLAACLEESRHGSKVGRVADGAPLKGTGASGQASSAPQRLPAVQTVHRSKAGSVVEHDSIRNGSERPSSSGNGRYWVPSSGPVSTKGTKPGANVQSVRASVSDRKEKQNKVGYPPNAKRATASSVFQVVRN